MAPAKWKRWSEWLIFPQQISQGREEFPISVLKLSKFGAELVGRRYAEDLRARANRPVKRITNKMPHNFELLGLIALDSA